MLGRLSDAWTKEKSNLSCCFLSVSVSWFWEFRSHDLSPSWFERPLRLPSRSPPRSFLALGCETMSFDGHQSLYEVYLRYTLSRFFLPGGFVSPQFSLGATLKACKASCSLSAYSWRDISSPVSLQSLTGATHRWQASPQSAEIAVGKPGKVTVLIPDLTIRSRLEAYDEAVLRVSKRIGHTTKLRRDVLRSRGRREGRRRWSELESLSKQITLSFRFFSSNYFFKDKETLICLSPLLI